MSVVINTNYAATVAANNLGASSGALQRSLNRLSSGSKIVSPADDAAGLAVSMKLSATAKRQGAIKSNLGNAVSFLQTQDGVLKVTGKILDRISELKVLTGDPTKTAEDIENYNAEFHSLQTQLFAAGDERFNNIALCGTQSMTLSLTESIEQGMSIAGIDLLGGATGTKASTVIHIAPSSDGVFAPSGAGTLVANGGVVDVTGHWPCYLWAGDEAHYDGAGNWDFPDVPSSMSGTSLTLHERHNAPWGATLTFTPDGATTAVGRVAEVSDIGAVSLNTIEDAIGEIATHRAANGAQQSNLNFASELLVVNRANLEASASRITDVDVADESMQLARWNILVQSGTAMLSQANQSAQVALKLLG